jgi:hypothetical protein
MTYFIREVVVVACYVRVGRLCKICWILLLSDDPFRDG